MVSLEHRLDYFSRISETPKLVVFNNLLSGQAIKEQNLQNLSQSEELYFGVINAIQANSKSDFENYYNKKSKSKPSKDSHSPFVNDDFLIFAFIVGIKKFGIEKTWLHSILALRNRNEITITFENILNENYYSTTNLPEIVFMFLKLTDLGLINENLINFTFIKVTENDNLFQSRSDLQILCSVRSFDYILILKHSPDKSKLESFEKFNNQFLKRITYLTSVIQLVLFGLVIFLILKLPRYSPEAIIFIEKYNYAFTIFGALGLSILGNFIPTVKIFFQKIILFALGYPDELLKIYLGKIRG